MKGREKIRKSLAVVTLLISTALFAQSASAYVSYRLLSVPASLQQQSLWCWAASTEMVAKYFGANATQSDIVTYVKGSPVNVTGTVADVQRGLSKYNIKSSYIATTMTFQTIANQASNGQPMVASISYTDGTGHALVIRGYYEDTSLSKQDVYFIDPANATYNILPYGDFLSNSKFRWVNSVYAIYV
ncbi:C39 family peptidase [Tumebacillus sp. ITR2]|uniref:C39 family peptidase n=1 Tax=Tumebacillus amylolyticus TaxID=2801339 RepID=A0ABS1J4S5_9BACL|nr:papain-like cysteine protease family protein [Tumebacillus amylolyticus]MBL0385277.1 C39 family peptidase [Tumebacillus amylolyticus]